jgi:hypothetical protein
MGKQLFCQDRTYLKVNVVVSTCDQGSDASQRIYQNGRETGMPGDLRVRGEEAC